MKEKFTLDDLASKILEEIIYSEEEHWHKRYSKAEFVSCLPQENMALPEVLELLDNLIKDSLVNFEEYKSKFSQTDSTGDYYKTLPEECRTLLVTYARDVAGLLGQEYDFEKRFKTEIQKLKENGINDELLITDRRRFTFWNLSYYNYKTTPINKLVSEERKAFYEHFGIEVFTFDDLQSRVFDSKVRGKKDGLRKFSKIDFVSCLPKKNLTLDGLSRFLDSLVRNALVDFSEYDTKFYTDTIGEYDMAFRRECFTLLLTYAKDVANALVLDYNLRERFKTEVEELEKGGINVDYQIIANIRLDFGLEFSEYDYKTTINRLTSEERKAFYEHFGIDVPERGCSISNNRDNPELAPDRIALLKGTGCCLAYSLPPSKIEDEKFEFGDVADFGWFRAMLYWAPQEGGVEFFIYSKKREDDVKLTHLQNRLDETEEVFSGGHRMKTHIIGFGMIDNFEFYLALTNKIMKNYSDGEK